MKKPISYGINNLVLNLIFSLAIFSPLLFGIIEEDKISSGIEKRNLATFPSFPESLDAINEYPEAFNLYYADHFGFREQFTKAYFKAVNKLGSQSSMDDVTIGRDGWLFLGSINPGYRKYNDPIGDVMNVNLFTEKELESFSRSIIAIRDWLKNKGIAYIYVIAPNKHTIYFDKLPNFISKKNSASAADQLLKYLKRHTDVALVDLRPPLLEEKKKHPVYFKSDTHWNHFGANVAQFVIMNKIKDLFPEKITPVLLADNQFKTSTKVRGDLAELAKIENITEDDPQPNFENECTPRTVTPDSNGAQSHTMICDTKELKAVIFRDSFFSTLQPYISRQFYRSTYIWGEVNYNSLVKYVTQEKPDIVIDEVVERLLPYIPSIDHFE